eukprot:gene14669-biopygen15688
MRRRRRRPTPQAAGNRGNPTFALTRRCLLAALTRRCLLAAL